MRLRGANEPSLCGYELLPKNHGDCSDADSTTRRIGPNRIFDNLAIARYLTNRVHLVAMRDPRRRTVVLPTILLHTDSCCSRNEMGITHERGSMTAVRGAQRATIPRGYPVQIAFSAQLSRFVHIENEGRRRNAILDQRDDLGTRRAATGVEQPGPLESLTHIDIASEVFQCDL